MPDHTTTPASANVIALPRRDSNVVAFVRRTAATVHPFVPRAPRAPEPPPVAA